MFYSDYFLNKSILEDKIRGRSNFFYKNFFLCLLVVQISSILDKNNCFQLFSVVFGFFDVFDFLILIDQQIT
jgi:hypothetical protein